MNIKNIKIIFVGKIKTSFWKEACNHYKERIGNFCNLQEITVKDADSSLALSVRIEKESQAILKNINSHDYVICLDEEGKTLSSVKFAEMLDIKALEKKLCFVIGGAYGVSQELLSRADFLLAFGKQTLPHELAHVLLTEQVFRVCSILKKTGYHHENPTRANMY